jgi:hypothetical protein
MVYDTCKDCATNQLNLNAAVFDAMAPLDLGNMPIMYRRVRGIALSLACLFDGRFVRTESLNLSHVTAIFPEACQLLCHSSVQSTRWTQLWYTYMPQH